MRGGGLAERRFPGEPGVDAPQRREVRDVQEWLGFPLPRLTPLEEAGHDPLCVTFEPGPLPQRGSLMPNGEPWEVGLALLWVPAGTDLSRVVLRHAVTDGFAGGLLHRSPGPVRETRRRATSLTEPVGGYTGVSIGGTRAGVQHSRPGRTRIGWRKQGPDASFTIALHLPLEPVPALELVLRSRNVP